MAKAPSVRLVFVRGEQWLRLGCHRGAGRWRLRLVARANYTSLVQPCNSLLRELVHDTTRNAHFCGIHLGVAVDEPCSDPGTDAQEHGRRAPRLRSPLARWQVRYSGTLPRAG